MTQTRWLDQREARAWRALEGVRAPLEAAMNRQLSRDSGLSTADYAIMVALSETPDHRLRARDLVRAIGWEKSRLSHQLRRMESRGLVTREGCLTDGRGAYVRLTPAGVAAIQQAAPGHVDAVRRYVLDGLTPDQLEQLAVIAEMIGARLRAEGCAAAEAECTGSDASEADAVTAAAAEPAEPAEPAMADLG